MIDSKYLSHSIQDSAPAVADDLQEFAKGLTSDLEKFSDRRIQSVNIRFTNGSASVSITSKQFAYFRTQPIR